MAIKTSIKPPWQVKVRSKPTAHFQVASKPKIQIKVANCAKATQAEQAIPTLPDLITSYQLGRL